MAVPINPISQDRVPGFDYDPLGNTAPILVAQAYRSGTTPPELVATRVSDSLARTTVLDEFEDVTNSTLFNRVGLWRVQDHDGSPINLAFTGQTQDRGAYLAMQLPDIDATVPVNVTAVDPNLDGGLGPFSIGGTTTAANGDDKTIIYLWCATRSTNPGTVAGATTLAAGITDLQITLVAAHEAQTTPGAFEANATFGQTSVRTPMLAVAYNTPGSPPEITVDEFSAVAPTVFQARATLDNVELTIEGDYDTNLGTPTSVESRVFDSTTGISVPGLDWFVSDATPGVPTAGRYTGPVVVARPTANAPMYRVESRWSDTPARVGSQVNRWGVGGLTLMYGQSLMEQMSTQVTSPEAQHPSTSYYDSGWVGVPLADGVRAFLNRKVALFGCPWAATNPAVGGRTIAQLSQPGVPWTNTVAQVTGMGGDFEETAWSQGEEDNQLDTPTQSYIDTLTGTLLPDLLALNGRSTTTHRMYISILGNTNNYPSSSDASLEAIRDALRTSGGTPTTSGLPGIVTSHTLVDIPLRDAVHLFGSGYAISALRFAQTSAHDRGLASAPYPGTGPAMSALAVVGGNIQVTVAPNGTTGLNAAAGVPTVFRLTYDDFATLEPISSFVIDSPTQFTITPTTPPAVNDTVRLTWLWGQDLTLTNVITGAVTAPLNTLPLFPNEISNAAETTGVLALVSGPATLAVTGQRSVSGTIDSVSGPATLAVTGQRSVSGTIDSVSGPATLAVTGQNAATGIIAVVSGLATLAVTGQKSAIGAVTAVSGPSTLAVSGLAGGDETTGVATILSGPADLSVVGQGGVIQVTNDNDIFRVLRQLIIAGLVERGLLNCEVKQRYQPVRQGVPEGPVIFIYKIAAPRYGYPGSHSRYNELAGDFDTEQSIWRKPTYQISGLKQQDPEDTASLTASDMVEIVADILQTPATRSNLLQSGVGIERVTDVRLLYFVNDKDRHEQEPSFDFTLSYRRVFTVKTPVITTTEVTIQRV